MRDATELWLIVIAAAGAAITAVVKTWRNLRRLSRMVDEFLGYDDHPGIGERVTELEQRLADMERMLHIALAAQGIDPERI